MYQFNTEKLEYNHLVLVERDRENYITANQQKRKLNKQRDTLVVLKGRYNELEKRFNDQNSTMGHGFAHVTKLLQDLQHKEHSLLASHAAIRRNFFLMHQRALSVLVSKILQVRKQCPTFRYYCFSCLMHHTEMGNVIYARNLILCFHPTRFVNPCKAMLDR